MPRVPYDNTGPYYNNMPLGIGVVLAVPATVAGGTQSFNHNLGRVPNRCEVLSNGAAYKGDCFFTATSSKTCTVQFEMAQGGTGFIWIV